MSAEGPRSTNPISAYLERTGLGAIGRSLGIASIVGVAGGLAAIAFEYLIHLCRDQLLAEPFGIHAEGLGSGFPWWVILAPAVGGALTGLLIQRFCPEAEGHGTERLVKSFHRENGRVRARIIAVKSIASALTIGSGGSAGREGPVAQIGSGVGASLADAFKLSDRDRRIFLLSGASAGISAMFFAPLGGALFVPEVLYKKAEFEGDAIIPCIIASIVGYTTRTTLGGASRPIPIPEDILRDLSFGGAAELPVYLALALACVLVGWIYVRVFNFTHQSFQSLPLLPRWLRPALGGLLLGLLALLIAPLCGERGVLFGGYALIQDSVDGSMGVKLLVVLLLGKILATSLSIGSGGSGGMFAPSLAIGALLGSLVGKAAQALPGLGHLNPAVFALVGMGGFFAGVAHTPVAATIIVCEMTGGYDLLAPLVLVSVLHMVLVRGWTIFESQVNGLVDSPAHAGEFVVDVLQRMPVAEMIDKDRQLTLVDQNATLRQALSIVSTAIGSYFPVVDEEQRLVGIFALSDVRRIFLAQDVQDLVIVKDFMVDKVATVQAQDDLNEALRRLNEYAVHEIPVVADEDPRRVIAMLSRNNIGRAYHKRLQELKRGTADRG